MSHKLTQEELKALENGYSEMAQISIELAEEGVIADNEALREVEKIYSGKCE